ncbi:ROK family protein [Candidatus Kaiserbacteria bacterium]|nr:ROK family protein [Candidatus Kaiserbacteria bacterium]
MYIIADIGGTKMRIAGSRDLEHFDEPVIIKTPQSYQEGIAAFVETAKEIAAGEEITKIAAGVPALLSRDRRVIAGAGPHIPEWIGKHIADDIETALSTNIYFENDVAQIGLGEATAGAGQGARIMMYITVSTGVNGVRIVDNKIDPAVFGTEIGHQYLSPSSNDITWEDLLSGSSIEKRYGKHPRDLGPDSSVWEDLAIITAFGLHNAILFWSPDRIVLGGSMFNEIGISVERVRFHLERITKVLPELPEILHSSLGDLGGLHGGLARLRQLD